MTDFMFDSRAVGNTLPSNMVRAWDVCFQRQNVSPKNETVADLISLQNRLTLMSFKAETSWYCFTSYPETCAVLLPRGVGCQRLFEATLTEAVFVKQPHFTVQPAGGRYVPGQHCSRTGLLFTGPRHGYIFPNVLF